MSIECWLRFLNYGWEDLLADGFSWTPVELSSLPHFGWNFSVDKPRWVPSTMTALVTLATNAFQNQQVYSDYYQWRQYLSEFFILFFCDRKTKFSTPVYTENMREKLWLFCSLIKIYSSLVKILDYIQYPLHKMDHYRSTWYEKAYVAKKKSKISFSWIDIYQTHHQWKFLAMKMFY